MAAAEQNAILRIGWTNAGDPVPKNGELGLCPGLPEGARLRALGVLGSWVAAFGPVVRSRSKVMQVASSVQPIAAPPSSVNAWLAIL